MSDQSKTGLLAPIAIWVCTTIVCFVLYANYAMAASDGKVISGTGNGAQTQTRILPNINQYERQQIVNVIRSNGDYPERSSYPSDRVVTDIPELNGFGDRMYIVQPGETGEIVAQQLTGRVSTWNSIAEYNKLGASPQLKAGQLIYIPEYLQREAGTVSERVSSRTESNLPSGIFTPSEFDSLANNSNYPDDSIVTNSLATLDTNSSTQFSDASSFETPEYNDAQLLAFAVDDKLGLPAGEAISSTVPDLTTFASASLERLSTAAQPNPGTDITERNVDMFAGQARVFGKVAVDRVAVGNGAILRAEILDNGDLLTIAQAEGSSSLHLWHKDGSHSNFNIRVSASDPQIRVRLEKTVRMRVKMIEFRKSAMQRLGIDWGDSIEGPMFAAVGDAVTNTLFRPDQSAQLGDSSTLPLAIKPFSSYFGIATQLTSRINLLVNRGDAEMLAEPVLSCGNGGTARFLAGGEVPYPTVGANGQTTVNFREYGIRLEISPRVDEFNNIQAEIMTEVSSIDSSVTVMGAPGLLTRRTQTEVNTRVGNTIVIAGLMQVEQGEDKDSLPGLGRVPVLGKLFRSDSNRRNVSELVIFITPEVVEPGLPGMTTHELQTHQYVRKGLQGAQQQIQNSRKQ